MRALVAALLVVRAALGPTGTTGEPPAPCLWAPVSGPVIDGFRSPWCLWCRGNRGLEYGVVPGSAVRAAAGGVVRFAGLVARVRYVVVEHPSGLRTTYGRLASAAVATGDPVGAGQVLGRAAGPLLFFGVRPAPGALHWGSPSTYLDPNRFLARRLGRARLVPVDGTPARSRTGRSGSARLTCTAREAAR